MDAVNLQGVWPTFPNATPQRISYAVALYNRFLEDAVVATRNSKNPKRETPAQRHRRVLDKVIARITQEHEDDEILILAL
jgi:hypothetical protein